MGNYLNYSLPIISIIIAISVFFLGTMVFLSGRNKENRIFFVLTLSAVFWIFSTLLFINSDVVAIKLFFGRAAFLAGTWIVFLIYYFVYLFPVRIDIFRFKYVNKILLLSAALLTLVSISPLIVENVVIENMLPEIKFGVGLYFFTFYFSVCIIFSLVTLLSKRRILSTSEKVQTDSLLAGIFISSFLAISTNVLLPVIMENDSLSQYGPLALSFFIIFASYAILRYKLFNVEVIAIQFTIISTTILFTFKLLVSETKAQMLISGILVLTSLVFGLLLIRGALKDISDRRKIEQLGDDLVVANEQLRQLDKQKSDFVSIASHQLRTPLTAIKGYASLILENSFGDISDKVREAVTKIFESSQRMVMIVENFLTVSRIEQGRMYYKFETLNLQLVVKNMLEEVRPVAEGYGLEIRFREDRERQYLVRADNIKIKQVIHNIFDDSISNTPEGFINVSISLSQFVDSVLLSVSDTGKGATKNELRQMFEKYEPEIDDDEIRQETGVELFIAKEIIKAHRGKIWAESEGLGKGVTYFIELPIVKNNTDV